jgi:hypothetical protein
MAGRKIKYHVGDTVVVSLSSKYIVGKVSNVKIQAKALYYDVTAEDGKEYTDLRVDNGSTYSIVSKLSKKYSNEE